MIIFTDIHGCFLTFQKLYNDLKSKFPEEQFCIAGDLIDRGPRSYEVVQFVIDNKIDCIRGNHEQMLLCDEDLWLGNGGQEALNSYPDKKLTIEHIDFFDNLPYYLEYRDIKNERGQFLLVTHAGLQGDLKDIQYEIGSQEILWNRSIPKKSKEYFNVFGHTPVCDWKPKLQKPVITNYYACIDTGACYTQWKGVLTALRFPQMEVFQQENIE